MYLYIPNTILGNGYIEGTELDGFLREFVSSANITDIAPEVRTSTSIWLLPQTSNKHISGSFRRDADGTESMLYGSVRR